MTATGPRFCSRCGAALARRVPPGDDRARLCCTACAHVHYQNPLVVVGTLVERGGGVLLCRRAIEPARGRWTVPAGFLELGESRAAGAARETREEAGVDVEVLGPHSLLDLPHIAQTYTLFRARARSAAVAAGAESLEARYVPVAEIPWDELAFPTIHFALRWWLDDRERGLERVHCGVVEWSGQGSRWNVREYRVGEYMRVGDAADGGAADGGAADGGAAPPP